MKTSITTILWGKMHSMPKLRKVVREAKEIGYDGVGLETRLLPLEAIKDPGLVKRTLSDSGIENEGSYSTMKDSDIGWASKAGTPLLWVVARGDHTFDEAVRAVDHLASLASKSAITIALHNHLGTPFETEPQMRKVLRQVKGLHVCLDTGHAEATKIDTIRFIHDFGDRIALVHVKDLRARLPKDKVSITKDFVTVGDGIVDFPRIFGSLKDAGYSGSLMLEIEALEGKSPDGLAAEGYRRIQDFLRGI